MKKFIAKILFITLLITSIIINISFGFTISDLNGNTNQLNDAKNVGSSILYILSIIGSASAIIFMIILGIKYMIGSTEEKAAYKRTLLPYLIGAIFVFGASIIANVIYSMFN